jgi:histidine triad (HIT) family protein
MEQSERTSGCRQFTVGSRARHLDGFLFAEHTRLMSPKLLTVRLIGVFVGLSALLLVQTKLLVGQQIPASELPPPGVDTGLDGKYDPQNIFARLIRGEDNVAAKISEDEHVIVFMPRGEVVAPGHVIVIPKRMGARNLLDLKPDEMCDLLVAVQKAGMAQKKGLGATGFRVQQNNGLSGSQGANITAGGAERSERTQEAGDSVWKPRKPRVGGKAPGTPAPRKELPDPEYNEIAAKLKAAWPKNQ